MRVTLVTRTQGSLAHDSVRLTLSCSTTFSSQGAVTASGLQPQGPAFKNLAQPAHAFPAGGPEGGRQVRPPPGARFGPAVPGDRPTEPTWSRCGSAPRLP